MIPIGPVFGVGVGYGISKNLPVAAVGAGAGWAAQRWLTWEGLWVATKFTGVDLWAGATAATQASYIWAGTAAVVAPVVVGYTLASLISGETGRKDLTDFLTGKVSPSEYVGALKAAQQRERNLAVEGNAAGLPTGTPIGSDGLPYSQHVRRHAEYHGMDPKEYQDNLWNQ